MGADDDADCVEHEWELAELGVRRGRIDTASECARCGALSYEPAPSLKSRPPL